ncbi:MAG TPA: hypothetical protein VFP84_38350 [Kofleriaceae bacterium]|nr:hypothetical protein [Kofleriaceae bacterium]
MSSACPACGVAVVPGYIRCPKCRAPLTLTPSPGTLSGSTTGRIPRIDPGGTALSARRFPITAIAVGCAVVVTLLVVLGLRGGTRKTQAAPAAAAVTEPAAAAPSAPDETPRLLNRDPAAAQAALARTTAPAAAPDPGLAVRDLEATLRQQRLWGRVELRGARVDLRSGSCADRAMRPAIESKASLLRGAGLTKLRCLEQSGAVVFERDL